MTRRQQLENYIIGSCLCNREHIKDTVVITPDIIINPLSRRIFELLPTLTSDEPINDIVNNPDKYGFDIVRHAAVLAGEYDFDWKKMLHNIQAKTSYLFGLCDKKPTKATFQDYVSQFLKYTYATTTETSRRTATRPAN